MNPHTENMCGDDDAISSIIKSFLMNLFIFSRSQKLYFYLLGINKLFKQYYPAYHLEIHSKLKSRKFLRVVINFRLTQYFLRFIIPLILFFKFWQKLHQFTQNKAKNNYFYRYDTKLYTKNYKKIIIIYEVYHLRKQQMILNDNE